jgi:hypothetical protein
MPVPRAASTEQVDAARDGALALSTPALRAAVAGARRSSGFRPGRSGRFWRAQRSLRRELARREKNPIERRFFTHRVY